MSNFEEDDLLREFLAEAREHLDGIEADLLTIEDRGADIDELLVNRVFRAAHSIKGGSGFFGLSTMKELAHRTETVLSMIRSREMVPNPEVVNILLHAFDKLREVVNDVSNSNDADISEHVTALTSLSSSFLPREKKAILSETSEVSFGGGAVSSSIPSIDLSRAVEGGKFIYLLRLDLIHDVERVGRTPLAVVNELLSVSEIIDARVDLDAVGTLEDGPVREIPFHVVLATLLEPDLKDVLADTASIRSDQILVMDAASTGETATQPGVPFEIETPPVSAAELALAEEPPTVHPPVPTEPGAASLPAVRGRVVQEGAASTPSHSPASAENTLRVNVEVLETLMNLAGELVLSRNELREAISRRDERAVAASSQRINLVTSDLQEAIMQTRMQPVGNVFGKFPRVVRDLSRTLGKEVQLEIEGREVELDKTLIEGLSDPLTHMVRNAIDHGVEMPDERVKRGKKAVGTVRLRACHEAGQVVIEVGDDGKGIDPAKIAASALRKGLISAERLRGMSDKDKAALIFLPGLSTADQVSDVSGRGVGMDVVKTNLDRLGGKVEIQTEPGKGSLFRIKLPLTLAIIPSLIVTVEEERFAIPQVNVVELIRVPAEQVKNRIEVVGDAEVLLLRGNLIPIVRLADVLGLMRTYLDPGTGRREIDRRDAIADRRSPRHPVQAESTGDCPNMETGPDHDRRGDDGRRDRPLSDMQVVVVSAGILQYGLVVDSMQTTEEIVVKPLGRHLKGLQEYAGATIMGDGKVALILDASGLAVKGSLTSVSGSTRAGQLAEQEAAETRQDMHSWLLYHNAPEEMCAIPLDYVLRLEKIESAQIEYTGGRRTMQYRGATLPLVTLADAARVNPLEEGQDLVVIVFNTRGREVGLLGAMPVDVIETRATVDNITLRQPGIVGSAIIRDRTVLLVDLHEVVEAVYPEWGTTVSGHALENGRPHTVLLAEDSDFFRAQIKRFLSEDGYNVLEAPDGEAAWEVLLGNAEKVEVVVTDIEMPRLTGLELTQRIRADRRFTGLPVIGLTSLAGEEDIERGKAAGIDDYQVKLDRDKLVESLQGFVGGSDSAVYA